MLFKKTLLAVSITGCAMVANAATTTATFNVTMKITSSCSITTVPTTIDLGTAVASTTAISNNGSTTFKVNCSNKTPFFIGMAPSAINGGTDQGIGKMKGLLSTPDSVPYTLYSDAGFGAVWGNTSTTTSVGNGLTGTGSGMGSTQAKSFTVYAKALNADFAPDTYTDTVTVNVNY